MASSLVVSIRITLDTCMKTFSQHILNEKTANLPRWIAALKSGKYKDARSLHKAMVNNIFIRSVGAGFYSIAYTGRTPENVLKITRSMGSKGDPWPAYAEWIIENRPKNPLFPRIHYMHEWEDGTIAAFMEHLDRKGTPFDEKGMNEYIRSIAEWGLAGPARRGIKKPTILDPVSDQYLLEFVEVCKPFLEHGAEWDIRSPNILFRKGYPVMADPLKYFEKKK